MLVLTAFVVLQYVLIFVILDILEIK